MPTDSAVINALKSAPPQSPCIANTNQVYNYAQVYELVQKCRLKNSLFKPQSNLQSIITLLRYFYEQKPLQLHNPNDPNCHAYDDLIPATIYIPTSGTQKQKLVAHNEATLVYSALNLHPEFALDHSSTYALSLPLHHISGLMIVLRSILHKGLIALKGSVHYQRATHISLCTNQLLKILDKNHYPNLKALLLGGGPLNYPTLKKAHTLGYPIFTTYGMSEMASQITTAKFEPNKPLSMGHPLKGRHLKLCQEGRVWVKGECLFQGYHNAEANYDHEGFLQTSDRAELFDYGLVIHSRIDNCIISGAENIHPEELERAFLSIQEVQKVKISSRADPHYSARPVATLWLTHSLTKQEILKILNKKLMKYKIPFERDLYLKKFIN